MFKASSVLSPDIQAVSLDSLWTAITQNYAVDEAAYLEELMALATPGTDELRAITQGATKLIEDVRAQDDSVHMVDALLQEYSLDTQEGVLLMCLAEALMRIPDKATADALIRDKMSAAQWEKHMGKSESTLVNASTWGLLLTGKVVKLDRNIDGTPANVLKRLINKCGEPVIRSAMNQAMKIMGKQFVLGRDISEALQNGRKYRDKGYSYSFDMLGEAALTAEDAERYFQSYIKAIETVGADQYDNRPGASSISIKLSALHPRYEQAHQDRVLTEMYEKVLLLVRAARERNVSLTIDAEEMDRLELSLRLFEKLYRSPDSRGWGEFGLVVQAYSKRALPVLCWLTALAAEQGDRIPVRLVKGAYWDSEIKLCQQRGLPSYPVYTRKESTDVSYLACARFLFSEYARNHIYPQFATHNAHTVASVQALAEKTDRPFEFQRLHGMGDALYNALLAKQKRTVRIYAPVGAHKDLLPYLVRRLLENGANSSFVHRLVDAETPIDSLVQHPLHELTRYSSLANHRIPLPAQIFGNRINSMGVNLFVENQYSPLEKQLRAWDQHQWKACPVINGEHRTLAAPDQVLSPYDQTQSAGTVYWSQSNDVDDALSAAYVGFEKWNNTPVDKRAQSLEKLADLMEAGMPELMALCCREAGKTLQDSIDEVREAVDFCRYYAEQARKHFSKPNVLPGPTGESNELYLEGKGVFVCISPWNFPLAIFIGQVTAALAAGNAVIAKPAEQTNLIAARAIEMMLEAGVAKEAIQFLPGDGAQLGPQLLSDNRVCGVAFTGSTQTAHIINRTLAARDGAIATLIAETGGQNAMIVDSTALPEQVVKDVVQSAFASAGQRCSALRVLFVQKDIADGILELLSGALKELKVDHPKHLSTDVGPVIDAEAQAGLLKHIEEMKANSRWKAEAILPGDHNKGFFVTPSAFEIGSISELSKEHFGPILHIVRFAAEDLDKVIDSINNTGFGLTLGIHSRNETTAAHIEKRVKVGNTYINRNQIGAVVGVQPFGGHGLSGTGPKAGGPHYLLRFANERTRTINTTAVGGNATLLSLGVEHI
ncbi:bifunctional proline dehydrogenase/L-glutamate gamma-semialdehyde dehydrogenase PutA [Hahella sp. CR1]|uniref:bifunctional proline dehydrogenase/L-glutamate gamma-semialdehyde dehydrogenase PutA n=1 Tax=Hahella sp. CR1 TaxID=2992807 RepID=UPI002441A826|nr:bifunctional proline dehydrogenase/L-glutamate gamma-semialdehyde dehydrogenase PutA [Hahella sp. CR1]MDG9671535.1 bifunctional proline dehydrogenase/L-glutamate gamma-semialdehyde dehydrogenase PutA [Hahella sp. CR1]